MSDTKELREKLFYEQKNGYDLIDTAERIAVEEFCEGYKDYLDNAKTERLAVKEAIRLAEEAGFIPFTTGMEVRPGMKVYRSNRGKSLLLAVIGKAPMDEGCNIAAAHIDCPRLDLKQIPLHEDSEFAYFRTHYYGGIKKYQWLTVPLELQGVVALKSGETVEISIGGKEGEPQFCITDVLPHLAKDQLSKNAMEIIPAEKMNILLGSIPYDDEGSDRVKLAVMSMLYDMYGITEEDFLSAEIEAVPAYKTRDIGLDRSFIGGYGHDDRVCAYCELKAIMDVENPEKTSVCILADKEEIGSEGTSGMQSMAFECFIGDICDCQGVSMRRCFEKSFCLSADVCNAYDPMFAEVSEKRSNAKCNYGMGILKFTGRAGKGGTNDANAETVGKLRKMFDDHSVVWQMGALGKVDQGGGGTVALFMSRRNIDTIDAGVPVLSMHAPFELVSKFDTYMTYKGVKAVYDNLI